MLAYICGALIYGFNIVFLYVREVSGILGRGGYIRTVHLVVCLSSVWLIYVNVEVLSAGLRVDILILALCYWEANPVRLYVENGS